MPATVLHILEFQSAEFFSLFPEIRCSEYEIRQLKNFFGSSVNDAKDKERVVGCWERSCGIVLVKSFREIEGKYIDFLSTLLHKKVNFLALFEVISYIIQEFRFNCSIHID